MTRTLMLAAIGTALLGCEKKQQDKPAPPLPPPPAPGGTVAPAPPPAPAQPMPIACPELHIGMAKDKLAHSRDTTIELPYVGGTLDPTALAAALGDRAAKCIGAVLVTATDDVAYQDIVTVLDVARAKGFADVGFGEESMHNNPAAPIDQDTLATAPVVTVTKTEVGIGATKIPLAAADLEEQVQAALGAAKAAGAPSGGVVVLQADVATTGKTLNAIVRGGNQAGFGNVLFAVRTR